MAVTANVVSAGQTSAPLSPGSFTCGGVSYNYQSASLTADNPLSQGSKAFTVTGTDNAGNAGSTSWNVAVDNTAPTAIGLQTINQTGGTAGRAEVGDQMVLTYAEALHLPSVKTGWNGTATPITVTINNNVAGFGNNDTVTFDVNLGTVNLGRNNYTGAPNSVFGASMVWAASTNAITITLTSLSVNHVTTGASSTATYVPSTAILDLAGNSINTAATPTESGQRHF